MNERFLQALGAQDPHPSLGAHAETYGRLMGSWRAEMQSHFPGSAPSASLEIHFSWALEGRAVQDVWIMPPRTERARGVAASTPLLDWCGTTVRIFDPKTESWHATCWNAVSRNRIDLEGARQGDDIIQVGLRQGRVIRWTFTDIAPDAFTWRGYILELDASWRLEIEIRARREQP